MGSPSQRHRKADETTKISFPLPCNSSVCSKFLQSIWAFEPPSPAEMVGRAAIPAQGDAPEELDPNKYTKQPTPELLLHSSSSSAWRVGAYFVPLLPDAPSREDEAQVSMYLHSLFTEGSGINQNGIVSSVCRGWKQRREHCKLRNKHHLFLQAAPAPFQLRRAL